MQEMNLTVTTPESARGKWFRNAGRAARAYYYAIWSHALLELISMSASCDEEFCPELTDAKKRIDDLIAEIRDELIAKYEAQGVDSIVIRALINLYESNDDENEEASDEIFYNLFETDMIDKASIFSARLEDACDCATVELDKETNEYDQKD